MDLVEDAFIQKEIEVGLQDGVDIRPFLKPGMTPMQIRDLRLGLVVKKIYGNNKEEK